MSVQIKEYAPSSAKLKMLIYGKSGTGKTTFGATAPNVLFVSSEAGLLSVADQHVKYAQINTLQDLRDIYEFLKKGGHGFESVVIDSLTDIQNHIIAQITGGKRMPQKGEWSDFGFEMNKLLRLFRDLDMHVIFLALEKSIEGEESEAAMLMPDLYGSVRDKVGGFMDYVGRLSLWSVQDENGAKSSRRGICFLLNERFIAKARRGKFEPITEPNFMDILKIAIIEVGEEKIFTDVPNHPSQDQAVPQPKPLTPAIFPAEQGDVMRTNEQSQDLLSLWDTLMAWLEIDETKREAMREKTLEKYCGVKSWNMLRQKQAASFIEELQKQIAIAKKKTEDKKEEAKEGDPNKEDQSQPEFTKDSPAVIHAMSLGMNEAQAIAEVTRQWHIVKKENNIPDSATAKSPEEAEAHSKREGEEVEDRATRKRDLLLMERETLEGIVEGHNLEVPNKVNRLGLVKMILEKEYPEPVSVAA